MIQTFESIAQELSAEKISKDTYCYSFDIDRYLLAMVHTIERHPATASSVVMRDFFRKRAIIDKTLTLFKEKIIFLHGNEIDIKSVYESVPSGVPHNSIAASIRLPIWEWNVHKALSQKSDSYPFPRYAIQSVTLGLLLHEIESEYTPNYIFSTSVKTKDGCEIPLPSFVH
jgi:hypothetical protein